jgi:hypothetical protein
MAAAVDQRYPKFYASVRTYTLGVEQQRAAILQSLERYRAAGFMTHLVSGSSINAHVKEWADPRKDELFQRLARDVAAKPDDTSKWMYNYGSSGDEPADLGYWIGAEICSSYYARAKDKAQAVRNVVTLRNIEEMVSNSEYAWLLRPAK